MTCASLLNNELVSLYVSPIVATGLASSAPHVIFRFPDPSTWKARLDQPLGTLAGLER